MTKRTGTPWIKSSRETQLFGHMHHGGKRGGSHVQSTHNNAIALLSSSEKGALCLASIYPFSSANPGSARLRSYPDRRLISTSSASTPATSSTSAYLGRRPRGVRGVRGVICTLLSEVETPGETAGLGISRGEGDGGGNGERLFRLRSREGMKAKRVGRKQRKYFPVNRHSHNYPIRKEYLISLTSVILSRTHPSPLNLSALPLPLHHISSRRII